MRPPGAASRFEVRGSRFEVQLQRIQTLDPGFPVPGHLVYSGPSVSRQVDGGLQRRECGRVCASLSRSASATPAVRIGVSTCPRKSRKNTAAYVRGTASGSGLPSPTSTRAALSTYKRELGVSWMCTVRAAATWGTDCGDHYASVSSEYSGVPLRLGVLDLRQPGSSS